MTKSQDSPVTRETSVTEKGRPLIVTLKGSTMELRFKGKREVILLDYEVAVAAARKVAFRDGGGQLPGKLGGRKFKKVEAQDEKEDFEQL
jgi:hypothetical protein